jgi:geranylgeranyl diphosphate synthase type II
MSTTADPSAASIEQELKVPSALVEPYMAACLKELKWPGNLVDAMGYSLLGPGKRMRPILVIRGCEAVGGKAEDALAPAAAIEMIHCFSLIHDDLPAMDDDDFRRGRPTLHKHTNEAMAILAGDALMGLAFQLLIEKVKPISMAAELVRELAVGTNAMIAGQVYDTLPDFPASTDPLSKLRTIHSNKTGALIRASVRMGAIVAKASPEQLQLLTRYGDAIGLMFQIVDDLLDITQTSEHLGKTAGKDVEQGKLTYPAVMGIDASRAEVHRLQEEAHASLRPLGAAAGPLARLCDYLAVRTK